MFRDIAGGEEAAALDGERALFGPGSGLVDSASPSVAPSVAPSIAPSIAPSDTSGGRARAAIARAHWLGLESMPGYDPSHLGHGVVPVPITHRVAEGANVDWRTYDNNYYDESAPPVPARVMSMNSLREFHVRSAKQSDAFTTPRREDDRMRVQGYAGLFGLFCASTSKGWPNGRNFEMEQFAHLEDEDKAQKQKAQIPYQSYMYTVTRDADDNPIPAGEQIVAAQYALMEEALYDPTGTRIVARRHLKLVRSVFSVCSVCLPPQRRHPSASPQRRPAGLRPRPLGQRRVAEADEREPPPAHRWARKPPPQQLAKLKGGSRGEAGALDARRRGPERARLAPAHAHHQNEQPAQLLQDLLGRDGLVHGRDAVRPG